MNSMNNWATQAVAKLDEGRKEIQSFNLDETSKKLRDSKLSQKQKEKVMLDAKVAIVADSVCEAMKNFCSQSESFAKAVVEGGSLSECVKHVMDGTNYAISDFDAYMKCAAFYFPTATIGMSLTIHNVSTAAGKSQTADSGPILSLNLDDFLL